jgi:autophagy-related protein 18
MKKYYIIMNYIDGADEICSLSFNQDYSHILVGLRRGSRVFDNNMKLIREKLREQSIGVIRTLYSSSLMLYVESGAEATSSRRILHVYHSGNSKEITSMSYTSTILGVHLNRLTLVVIIATGLYIYDTPTMNLRHEIVNTENPLGIAALSRINNNFLAYPSNTVGEAHIYDTTYMRHIGLIYAHNSSLAHLEFNSDGTMLATASEKGTVIRIFSTAVGAGFGTKLYELRRGTYAQATIYSMCFNSDSSFFSLTSDRETVHIFKLNRSDTVQCPDAGPESGPASYYGLPAIMGAALNTALNTVISYLPMAIAEQYTQLRSFAQAKIDVPGIAALVGNKDETTLYTATKTGYFTAYKLDTETGECIKLRQHSLLGGAHG